MSGILSCPNLETLYFVLDHSPVTVVASSALQLESDFPRGLHDVLAHNDRVRCVVTDCLNRGYRDRVAVFAGRLSIGAVEVDPFIFDGHQAAAHAAHVRATVLGLVGRALQRVPPPAATIVPDDPFTVLGLARGASPEEVKAAHRRIAKEVHPDGLAQRPIVARLAEEHLKRVNRAFEAVKQQQGW